jgi:hypothetical protein
MSTVYYGDGTQPTPVKGALAAVNIESSTDATPIVIQTFSAHGFTNGSGNPTDTVEIEGHLVNTNANGVWQITVIDATHYALDGSTGTGAGAGGATGYAHNYSIAPAQTLLSDGDLAGASGLNPPVENLTNVVPFIYRRLGKYRLYDIYQTSSGLPVSQFANVSIAAPGPAEFVGGSDLLGFHASPAFAPVAQVNDILEARVSFSLSWTSGGGLNLLMGLGMDYSTGLVIDQGSVQGQNTAYASLAEHGINLIGWWKATAAVTFDLSIVAGYTGISGTNGLICLTPLRVVVHHYRPN